MAQPSVTAPVAPPRPDAPSATHPCVRCGAPVALDVGLCERCNPLGLSDSASSQAHGTVFVGIVLAVVALAILGRAAISGAGPYPASITAVQGRADGLAVTVEVRNDGTSAGSTVCRVTDPTNAGVGPVAIVRSPRIEGGQTLAFTTTVGQLGTTPRTLAVACEAP